MKTAVITIVSGRPDHLRRQREGLERSTVAPDLYIVVAMNDPAVEQWNPRGRVQPIVESLRHSDRGLPLATARNRGAARAIRESADLLVFLDVDCIPAPDMLDHYIRASEQAPSALLNGAVGYLPKGASDDDPATFANSARFHEFRRRLLPGEVAPADPKFFWSLSFALRTPVWRSIGGFCEQYVGYGAEDTDFGQLAARAGVESLWAGGAEAFHQYHPTSSPPVEHLDDILSNGALFEERWGFWPMDGWMRDFEHLGMVERTASGGWSRASVLQ